MNLKLQSLTIGDYKGFKVMRIICWHNNSHDLEDRNEPEEKRYAKNERIDFRRFVGFRERSGEIRIVASK